ncbi:hypothetical protein [Actinophytocola sp.]|uniref:hypothetical protein n=1 Tax=Actinophytocola sp. TaxID=1872138 RepID=UPI002ED4C2E4
MATVLPVPIEFELPDGWHAAPPDEAGAPGAAFVAVHPDTRQAGFTPNITISGEYRADQAALAELADESVGRLGQAAQDVTVADRTEIDSLDAPGLTQVVLMRHDSGDTVRDLVQCQVYLSMTDVHDRSRRAVLQLAMTATTEQLDDVIGDFQQFVASVRPEPRQP